MNEKCSKSVPFESWNCLNLNFIQFHLLHNVDQTLFNRASKLACIQWILLQFVQQLSHWIAKRPNFNSGGYESRITFTSIHSSRGCLRISLEHINSIFEVIFVQSLWFTWQSQWRHNFNDAQNSQVLHTLWTILLLPEVFSKQEKTPLVIKIHWGTNTWNHRNYLASIVPAK